MKVVGFWVWSLEIVLRRYRGVGDIYEQGELRGAEGEERRGEVRKRTDVPLQ
jgi:hypothetical protein